MTAPNTFELQTFLWFVFYVSIYICFKETIMGIQVAFQMLYLLYIFSMQMGNTVLLTETYTEWEGNLQLEAGSARPTWYIEIVQGSPQTDQ